MVSGPKATAVGLNHIALEVGDVEEALEFYGRLFDFKLRGRGDKMAFIDLGDQFIALDQTDDPKPGKMRHFGLVVDDKEKVKKTLDELGIEPLPGKFLDFLDPWGNRIEIVGYPDIQFTKTEAVMAYLGVSPGKTEAARKQLRDKGLLESD